MTILNLMKMAGSYPKGQKTWGKEKLLVTNIFSFSHSAFQRLVLQSHKNKGLFGKELIHFEWMVNSLPNSKVVDTLKLKAFADDKLKCCSNNWIWLSKDIKEEKKLMMVTSI